MKRKYKLKPWVKTTLMIIAIIGVFLIALNNIKDRAKECDLEKGYTCSVYELRNY